MQLHTIVTKLENMHLSVHVCWSYNFVYILVGYKCRYRILALPELNLNRIKMVIALMMVWEKAPAWFSWHFGRMYRQYHRKQLYNCSKAGRSVGLTRGGLKASVSSCTYKEHESEKPFTKCPLSFNFFTYIFNTATRLKFFDLHRSNQVTYRLLTHWKVVPYGVTYIIVLNFQSNRTEGLFPILSVRCLIRYLI